MRKYLVAGVVCLTLLVQCSKNDSTATTAAAANDKNVGASAHDFLSADNFTSINVQLQYMPGYAPDAGALANLTNYLDTMLDKPGGINITQTAVAGSGKSVFSLDDINAYEKANRTQFNSGNVMSVYVIYFDAPYSTTNVLGLAYRNTSLAVFGPTISSNSGGINQTSRTKLESIIEEHEFGHLLGLVNLGSAMVTPHEDGAHANHCAFSNCLMYYQTNTTAMGGILINSPIIVLDPDCRADLRANGGK